MIRNHSDDTPRTTKNNSYSNNSQPIITAEYLLNSLTDIGRIFLVKIDEPIDANRLTECQKEPLALSTFYMYFIKWICEQYDEIVVDMRVAFEEFRKNANYHISKYERLNEQIFTYTFAFDCFEKFASKCFDFDPTTRDCFIGYIVDCVKDQSDIMERIAAKEKSLDNLSLEIVDLMDYNKELIGEKGSDCFCKGKYLYITNQFFAQYLYKKYYQIISAKHITAYFRERGISEHYADHRIKKYNNRCYLILNIKTLRQDAKLTSYNNIFYNP